MKRLLTYVGDEFFANAGQAEVERAVLRSLAASERYRFRVLLDGDRHLPERFRQHCAAITDAEIEAVEVAAAHPGDLLSGVDAVFMHSLPRSATTRWLLEHEALFQQPTLQFVHSLPLSKADRLRWGSLWGRWSGAPCCGLIAPSEITAARARSLAAEAGQFGGSLPPVTVVPHGVQLDEVRGGVPSRGRERLGFPSSSTILLSLARISPEKLDYEQLILAYREIARRLAPHLDVRLALAGGLAPSDQSYVDHLHRLASQIGATKQISILTHITPREKADLLSAADLFVSIATNPQESFGIALLEAMAAGLPILATDWNGYGEVLPEGYAPYLLPTIADHDVANGLRQGQLSQATATSFWRIVEGGERLLRIRSFGSTWKRSGSTVSNRAHGKLRRRRSPPSSRIFKTARRRMPTTGPRARHPSCQGGSPARLSTASRRTTSTRPRFSRRVLLHESDRE